MEWQLEPRSHEPAESTCYEVVGASVLILRYVAEDLTTALIDSISGKLETILQSGSRRMYPVPQHGWLFWAGDGLRSAFLQALEFERWLTAVLDELERTLHLPGRFRWGIWLDQFVLRFGENRAPTFSNITANSIFNFEPDNLLLCSDALYEANRHWENFVCVPRRLRSGDELHGFRFLSHKRPSALDHARTADATPFLGRDEEIALLTTYYQQSLGAHTRVALVGEAGSGKTRLVRAWRQQHPNLRMLVANFSLFGGDLVSFARQLAELPHPITADRLLGAILGRIETEQIDSLVWDDLHWADAESTDFMQRLLEALSPRAILVLLVTRPSGRPVLQMLRPGHVLDLKPLASPATLELARHLISSPRLASVATDRSRGNPLFVEQFAGWAAETDYQGDGADAPQNLHQVIAARIARLSANRLSEIRQRSRWGAAWESDAIQQELDRLERDIGLWLDRLETGDYGDRTEVSHHLIDLERLDFEIFLTSSLAGKPRARSSRLREAIERLLVGSAAQILGDLQRRATNANDADKANILHEAQRAGDVLAARYKWRDAAAFYELALSLTEPQQQQEVAHRLAACRCRYSEGPITAPLADHLLDPDTNPAVDALRLPKVWLYLARRFDSLVYFRRAAESADAVHDAALAQWTQRQLIGRRAGPSSSK